MRLRATVALAAMAAVAGGALLIPDGERSASIAARPKPKPLVVVLILDEFPIDSILTPDGRIDSARFPNFAALAATSTWFPNATTVYDSTFKAVPAMLDARYPRKGSSADARDHPRSVYTMLDGMGWDVVNTESGSAVCPPRICRGARRKRPGVLVRLNRGGRPGRLRRWVRSIRPRRRPTLYLQHALLPHEPWIYLPSGKQSRPAGNDPILDINRHPGFRDPDLTRHNHQRYLLQTGYTDRELGVLLDQLRRQGLFDRALIVVTADHGYAFELNTGDRRRVTETNVEEIAPIPMFVKEPRQHRGAVDPGYVRTVDLAPTIAEIVGGELDWPHHGTSMFGGRPSLRDRVEIVTRDFSRRIAVRAADFEGRRRAVRERRARDFGTGFESSVLYGSPWASLYRIGPHPELLGTRVNAAQRIPSRRPRARFANARLLRSVSLRRHVLPTRVTGELTGGRRRETRNLAVAVNGTIAAVGRSFRLSGDRREWFSLMLPEDSLREGRNRLELLEIGRGGSLLALASG